MPPRRRAASTRAKPAPAAPPVDPGEAAVAAAVREAEEAAAALEAARKASEEASRNLQTLRAYARAGLIGAGGVLLRPPTEQLSHDVWRSEIFPRLSALDTMNAAAVSRAWAEEVASGVKGRGEVAVFSHNLVPPERALPLRSLATVKMERELLGLQAKLLPPPPPPPQPPQTPQQQLQQQQQLMHFDTGILYINIMRAEKLESSIRMARSVQTVPGLIERCRTNAGSLRRLRFNLNDDGLSIFQIEAVSSLVSALPLLSTIDITTPKADISRLDAVWKTPSLLSSVLRAVAEGVAASSLASARGGGGGSVRALALRGRLHTEDVLRNMSGRVVTRARREIPRGWAEGLGLVPSAAGATATTAAAATASTSAWPRPYEEKEDVTLASSAIALLAQNAPIEKLALDIKFWEPSGRGGSAAELPPPLLPAEAAARRAAPRTLGALLQPLANQLVDLSVDSEQWLQATRGGFAREGASAPPAPSSSATAAENSKPPPGLGPLPLLRVLRLVNPTKYYGSRFVISRASFEGIVRPSTLHFVKSTHTYSPFVVVAEDDDAAIAHIMNTPSRQPATMMAGLARLSQAPLDAALAPLADCVTELLIDIAESNVAQSFCHSFAGLRSLRRLAVRLARPNTSSKVVNDLNLSAFSRAHGATLTSLDVSGFVNRKLTASPPFAALRRLVMRGMRSPRGFRPPTPFRLPSQRGGYKEIEFLAVGFVGCRTARPQFTDREWYARFCELQSRRSQGFLDLGSLFAKKAPYPKLKLLLLENCDLVMTQVGSLAAFRNADAGAAAATATAASSSSSPLPPSSDVAGPAELAARFLAGSSGMVRIHLHGCRFQGAGEGCFVPAAAEVLGPSGTALTEDAARAAAFLRALASSVSSSSSSPPDGGSGGGGGKKGVSKKKGGGGPPPSPPPPPPFKGFCFGCDAFGKEWDEFVDEMKFCST